jgi:hypothetical protein
MTTILSRAWTEHNNCILIISQAQAIFNLKTGQTRLYINTKQRYTLNRQSGKNPSRLHNKREDNSAS